MSDDRFGIASAVGLRLAVVANVVGLQPLLRPVVTAQAKKGSQ
jgi:hypothetical protein